MSEIRTPKKKKNTDVKWEDMTLFEKFGAIVLTIAFFMFAFLAIMVIWALTFGKSSKSPEVKFSHGNRIIEDFIVYEKNYGKDWPFGYHDSARVICEVRDYGKAKNLPLAVVDVGGFWYGLNYAAINEGDYNKAQVSPPRIKYGTDARISYDGLIDMEKKALAMSACAVFKK